MSAGVPVGDAIRYAEALDKALLARLRAGGAVTDAELAAAGVGDAAHTPPSSHGPPAHSRPRSKGRRVGGAVRPCT